MEGLSSLMEGLLGELSSLMESSALQAPWSMHSRTQQSVPGQHIKLGALHSVANKFRLPTWPWALALRVS